MKTPNAYPRKDRLAPVILREINELLRRSYEFEGAFVSKVDLNDKCTVAHLFVKEGFKINKLEDDEDKKQFIKALGSQKSFFTKHLGKLLRMKKIPELRFQYDEALEHGDNLNELIDQLNSKS